MNESHPLIAAALDRVAASPSFAGYVDMAVSEAMIHLTKRGRGKVDSFDAARVASAMALHLAFEGHEEICRLMMEVSDLRAAQADTVAIREVDLNQLSFSDTGWTHER